MLDENSGCKSDDLQVGWHGESEGVGRHEMLLGVINEVAELMLASDPSNLDESVQSALQALAGALGVDRVNVWRNDSVDDDLVYVHEYHWLSRDCTSAHSVTPKEGFSYRETAPGWPEYFRKGGIVNGPLTDLGEQEKNRLYPYDIKSILVIPTIVHGRLWGFISFDDLRKTRRFDDDDIGLIRSGALMIATAIDRSETLETAIKASRAKSQFLSNMSHEIRTPLNTIIGMTTIGLNAHDPEKKDDSFKKIMSASRHLLAVINDILDMSKIEANKLELNEVAFNFNDMIERVTGVLGLWIEEKKQNLSIQLDTRIPPCLYGDDHRLAQVIANLLSNAVKFTPEGGSIRLEVACEAIVEDVHTLRFSISDTGIGISKGRQERLFESFEQADSSTSRKFGGTGLGLSICKRFVNLMGGEISVESTLGGGSTFCFVVDLEKSETCEEYGSPAQKCADETLDIAGRRILLVEDVAVNCEIVAALLEPYAPEIEYAENGLQAVEKIRADAERFDLILMDVQMPYMDGLQATRTIRALGDPWAQRIPIIAMTANVFSEDIAKCLESGMNGHVGKPIDLKILLETLQENLSR